MIKYLKPMLIGVFLFALVFAGSISPAGAATVQELQAQIQALLSQIASLQQQIAQQQGNQGVAWCHTFSKNLGVGMDTTNLDIIPLVIALYNNGIINYEISENGYDEQIASAVVEFQEKYASEILTPSGLKHGTGFVGKSTRAKLNKLYGCANKPAEKPTEQPQSTCKNLWWYDNDNKVCSQKQFCGAYMYLGLKTFSTESSCNINLNTQSNLPPIINSISGPTTLNVGQAGTWTINATDPENKTLYYGVRWNDVEAGLTAVSSAVFNHTYSVAGTYTIDFYVYDAIGNTGNATHKAITLNVGNAQPTITMVRGLASNNYETYVGEKLSITGSNLAGNSTGTTNVYIGQWKAAVEQASDNLLWVRVPQISAGTYDLYVSNEKGRSNTVSIKVFNQVTTQPSITVTSPNGGEVFTVGQNIKIGEVIVGSLPSDTLKIGMIDYEGGNPAHIYSVISKTDGVLSGEQAYSYLIPSIVIPSGKLKIMIEWFRNGTLIGMDTSDNYFTIIAPTTACADSDNGLDYYTYGNVKVGSSMSVDKCWGNELWEYYCDNNKETWKGFTCANGCENGACKKASATNSCTDSDGGKNYDAKGTVTGSNGSYTDYCYAGSASSTCFYCSTTSGVGLKEYYCADNGSVTEENYTCPNGCENGVCKQGLGTEEIQKQLGTISGAIADLLKSLGY